MSIEQMQVLTNLYRSNWLYVHNGIVDSRFLLIGFLGQEIFSQACLWIGVHQQHTCIRSASKSECKVTCYWCLASAAFLGSYRDNFHCILSVCTAFCLAVYAGFCTYRKCT